MEPRDLKVSDGVLNFSSRQNISTQQSFNAPVVVELRVRFKLNDDPRLGFFTLASPDTLPHAFFKGIGGNKVRSSANATGGTFSGPELSDVESFHTYKIYRTANRINFSRDGQPAGEAPFSYSDSQPLTILSANTNDPIFIDWVSIYRDNTITFTGLSSGQRVEMLDRGGNVKASAIVPSGETSVRIDAMGTSFPLNGTFKVYSSTGALLKTENVDFIFGGDSFNVAGVGTYTLEIKEGLNLISSPIEGGIPLSRIEQDCGTLREIGVPGSVQAKAWSWDAAARQWQNPTVVNPGKGTWISSTRQCFVTVSGTPFKGEISLSSGLNLISSNGDINRIDHTCGGKFRDIGVPEGPQKKTWSWNASTRSWYHPHELSPPNLDPRNGAWVSVTEACAFANDCSIQDSTSCPSGKTQCADMLAPTGKIWCR